LEALGPLKLKATGIPYGDTVRAHDGGSNSVSVEAICKPRYAGGWWVQAKGSQHGQRISFRSAETSLRNPIAIVDVFYLFPRALAVVLAEVGWGMTGQPYKPFRLTRIGIVPLRMTFASWSLTGLEGGGAAEHGQGVFCSSRDSELIVTQVFWSGPPGSAPTVPVAGGGETPAPQDRVAVQYERWRFGGEPLAQISVQFLPSRTITYAAANALDGAHC
jgi:hypothetical protein